MAAQIYVGRVRNLVTHSLLSLITLGLYFFYWFTRLGIDMRKHRGRGPSGLVLILVFVLVPVLGWVVAPLLAGLQLRRIQVETDSDKRSSIVLPALWGLLPIVGWAISAGLLQEGANRVWLRLHRHLEHSIASHTILECPHCSTRFDAVLHPFHAIAMKCPGCGHAGDV